MGKKYGVDVKDPVALKTKLDEINALRDRLKIRLSNHILPYMTFVPSLLTTICGRQASGWNWLSTAEQMRGAVKA